MNVHIDFAKHDWRERLIDAERELDRQNRIEFEERLAERKASIERHGIVETTPHGRPWDWMERTGR